MTVWTHTQGVYPARAGDRRDAAHAAGERALHPCRRRGLLRPQRRRRCRGGCRADRPRAARPAGARAMDARAGARLGAVRPGHGDQAAGLARRATARSSTGITRCGATPIRRGPAAPASCWRRSIWRKPFALPAPRPLPQPEGGGDRNAIPLYEFPNARWSITSSRRCRCGCRRCARSAPTERVLDRELHGRARRAPAPIRWSSGCDISRTARRATSSRRRRERFGWTTGHKPPPGRGRGFAFARYKNLAAYCAVASRSRWTARPAVRGWCARSRRSTAARRSIRTASATRSRAASCSR